MKNSFVFYGDWWNSIKSLPAELGNKLLRAICAYALDGEEPTDPAVNMALSVIRVSIDRNNEKWEEIREKRREAGRKGAEVTNAESTKRRQVSASVGKVRQSPANPAVNVNVNDNVNDNNLTFSNEKVERDLGVAKSPTNCQKLSKFLGNSYKSRAKIAANIWNEEARGELAGIMHVYGTKPRAAKRRAAIDGVLLEIAEATPGLSAQQIFEQYRNFTEWIVRQVTITGELEAPSSRAPFDKFMAPEYVGRWTESRNGSSRAETTAPTSGGPRNM
ncbi:MAG: DUF6291 domain-containing protein [Muribaculaceae bacterium]|nr:DUF6291 domain-containing protein [Muribaculaceae bacterium]